MKRSDSTGLVVAVVDDDLSDDEIRGVIDRARHITPPGRCLCVIFGLPTQWQKSTPVEAIASESILGKASDRVDEWEWEFFGNVFIRGCRVIKSGRSIASEYCVVMYRKSGDKSYLRRLTSNDEFIDEARFNAIHPVFTRDVANNVWHLSNGKVVSRIIQRLSGLLTWPDEKTRVVSNSSTRSLGWRPLNLDKDLIGVPTKVEYQFPS